MSRQHLEQDYYLLEALHNCENAGRMPRAKLRLYFDMRSGFTYLAYVVTRRSSVFTECDISYVPGRYVRLVEDLRQSWGMDDQK